ncbi:MAG: ferritin-like domain-containing protein [Archangiaceae bacterium]|nr:ferritin-like domain-containing protein [Archangiaceae bacterium]
MFGGASDQEQKLSSTGTACATAVDQAACSAALTALKSTGGWGRICNDVCSAKYLARTWGDTVNGIETAEALKAFLGTIDTAQEAVLLASTQPINIACNTDLSRGSVKKSANGWVVVGAEGVACGEGTAVTQHVLEISPDGSVKQLSTAVLERGQAGCAIGRRPCGLGVAYAPRAQSPLARHFVAAAHLEAASVPAFLKLGRELQLHRAPAALQLRCRLSAWDEVRHARSVAALARRFGGRPVRPTVAPTAARSLREVALDNAVEGCVRETFGALVAHRQARRAADPAVAAALTAIAADETRHAALSWDLHAWALSRLPRPDLAEVRAAQRRAVAELRAESSAPVDASLEREAGLPPADEAVTLVDALSRSLWA